MFLRRHNPHQSGPQHRKSDFPTLGIEQLEVRVVLSADPIFSPTVQLEIDPAQYEAGSILVRTLDDQPFAIEQIGEVINKAAAGTQGANPIRDLGAGWHRVELPSEVALEDALALYQACPNVVYAEPNYVLSVTQLPDDTRFSEMWGLENTGQTLGKIDADIDADYAWDVTTGSGETVVAVIDTGINYNHPDLAANMWVNSGEIPGDGLDNDQNGYRDDLHGYDFVNNDGDPMDDQGHGTHVAGTIGAAGNNGLGVTGINWDVQLMGLKFLDGSGFGTSENAIKAINYAVENGADIINASWGGDPFSQALYDAIAAAGAADVVFVAAAGNGNLLGIGQNNDAIDFYPSGYDLENILAVAATDHNDNLAGFSNYGATTVDLAAPGVGILSTTLIGYGLSTGTSMAAPHVAGVAALLHDLHPDWSAEQIIQEILDSADPLPNLQGLVASGGRLNTATAVGNPAPPPPPPPPVPLPSFEDFQDGQSSMIAQTGNWSASSQRYTTTPAVEDPTFVSISLLSLADPLPSNVEIRTVMEADLGRFEIFGIPLTNHLTNGYIVYDYTDTDNFKFAGADIHAGLWVLGQRVAGSWQIDSQLAEAILPDVQYDLRLLIENDTQVALIVDGVQKLTTDYGSSVILGGVGVAARDGTSHFDDLLVQQYVTPVPTTLPLEEDLRDGLAENFRPELGAWVVDQGRYEGIAGQFHDAVSLVQFSDPLPTNLQILTTLNANDATDGKLSNGFTIFDYQNPSDFKFAGAYVGADYWLIGHRTADGWVEYATLTETIDPLTDYALEVRLEGQSATVIVDGQTKLSHTFDDLLTDGNVGFGTSRAQARLDNIEILEFVPPPPPPPPPSGTLPISEDFDDGLADYFEAQAGTWTVESGRYRVVPAPDQAGLSTLRVDGALPTNVELVATINADPGSVGRLSNAFTVFDYHDPLDFKFAGAYVGADYWLIGHRTASGWVEYATFDERIDASTDYDLTVRLQDDTATLLVNGSEKVSYTFGETIVDGSVGLATSNALASFDDVELVEYVLPPPPPPPPSGTLPISEDFDDGLADFFEPQTGTWTVESGRYRVVPAPDQAGLSTLRVDGALPTNVELVATINADPGSVGRLSNAFTVFDYHDPLDFKFAGAYVGADYWLIGHRTASGWVEYATFDERIDASTDYDLTVRLQDDTATLLVNGSEKVSYTFGETIVDGSVGLATSNALASFDDVELVEYVLPPPPPPPPSGTLPISEDFDDGVADYFEAQAGTWTVQSGRYQVVPVLDQQGISTLRLAEPLPADVEILATINADDLTPGRFSNGFVIFDYQSPTDFKFAGAYVASNTWVIGHRTTSGWVNDVEVIESISAGTDYNLQVIVQGNQVRLLADGGEKLSRQYSDILTDGQAGIGTSDALTFFDNVQVRAYAPQTLSVASTALRVSEPTEKRNTLAPLVQTLREELLSELADALPLVPVDVVPGEELTLPRILNTEAPRGLRALASATLASVQDEISSREEVFAEYDGRRFGQLSFLAGDLAEELLAAFAQDWR